MVGLEKEVLKSREEEIRNLEHIIEKKSSVIDNLWCKIQNLDRFYKLKEQCNLACRHVVVSSD